VRWPLTLWLRLESDETVQMRAALDAELLAISRLPWFRSGWTPDWARNLLVRTLTTEERSHVRSLIGRALNSGRGPTHADEDIRISHTDHERGRNAPVKINGITLNYVSAVLGMQQPLLTVREAWAKGILRKPLRRLVLLGGTGAVAAALMSGSALSLIPIDECDLLAASVSDNLRIRGRK
jgi:hypothetical protein